MRCVRRDLAGGRLPKDGHLLADLELRTIIEAYAEDQAIFFAVGSFLPPHSPSGFGLGGARRTVEGYGEDRPSSGGWFSLPHGLMGLKVAMVHMLFFQYQKEHGILLVHRPLEPALLLQGMLIQLRAHPTAQDSQCALLCSCCPLAFCGEMRYRNLTI